MKKAILFSCIALLIGCEDGSMNKAFLRSEIERVVAELSLPIDYANCVEENVMARYTLIYRLKRALLPHVEARETQTWNQWLEEALTQCRT